MSTEHLQLTKRQCMDSNVENRKKMQWVPTSSLMECCNFI